jgi:hypothetical protein
LHHGKYLVVYRCKYFNTYFAGVLLAKATARVAKGVNCQVRLDGAASTILKGHRMMKTIQIAKKLVELCKQGKNMESLNTLYADNAVSVEAMAMTEGGSQEAKGLAAIKKKGEWWESNHEVHSANVTGPWPNGDKFIVGFQYDVTNKPSGKRMKMEEMGLYTVSKGKIVREEFFYEGEA